MGSINIDNTGTGADVTLSSDGTDLLLDGTAIGGGGGGADLYAANESSPTAQPSATGTNAIAIGDSSTSSSTQSFAFGGGTSSGFNSFAFGLSSTSSQTYSNAFHRCTASGQGSFAAGSNGLNQGSVATGTGSMALATSYASNNGSFAAAVDNNTSSYGATGTNSIAMGYQAKATGGYSVAIGQTCTASSTGTTALGIGSSASGNYSTAIGRNVTATSTSIGLGYIVSATGGYSTALGSNVSATGWQSMALGSNSVAATSGKLAYAGGRFSANGDAQTGIYVLRSDTTDATAEALTTDNSSAGTDDQIILVDESAMTFTGTVVVREDATDGDDYAGWEIKGVIMRGTGVATTTLGVGIVNSLYHTAGLASASVALSADTTNGGLKIEVTGIAATNLRWVATVHTSEVVNA